MHSTAEQVEGRSIRERGASLVEYALLLALIAIACISALTFFGSESKNSAGHSTNCIIRAGSYDGPCS